MTGIREILKWQLEHDYFDETLKRVVTQFVTATENPIKRAYCPACECLGDESEAETECLNCQKAKMQLVWILNPVFA